MRKLKVLLLTMVLFVMALGAKAQTTDSEYKNAIGFVGHQDGGGISFKHFLKQNHAVEGWLTVNPLFTKARGTKLTGLYQIHHTAFDVEGLNWFYGGGAHLGAFRYDAVTLEGTTFVTEPRTTVYAGIDAVGGMDYKLKELPLNFSVIYNPYVNLMPGLSFDFFNVKVAARYTF